MLSLFKEESSGLIEDLLAILNEIEGEPDQHQRLEEFGQKVDRIMGSAKTLFSTLSNSTVQSIGAYAELCKILGYQGSQIENNEELYSIVVAFLIDATETLKTMTQSLGTASEKSAKEWLSSTFLDRLKWISSKFGTQTRKTIAGGTADGTTQDEILKVLKSLGSVT